MFNNSLTPHSGGSKEGVGGVNISCAMHVLVYSCSTLLNKIKFSIGYILINPLLLGSFLDLPMNSRYRKGIKTHKSNDIFTS